MSLVQIFGNYKNDLDKIILHEKELFKLSSAPLIIYKIKPSSLQPSADDVYNEYTSKEYETPVELRGYFQNPSLTQELIKMGLQLNEQIDMYFETTSMMSKLGRTLQVFDIIQPYHQRWQYLMVMNSYPNQLGERLFKSLQWSVICQKTELAGINLPIYLTHDSTLAWFTFSEHWQTEFLQDRERSAEQREYLINGSLTYFWQHGNFFSDIDIGAFNGTDNYIDCKNNFNFGTNAFTISIFCKPDLTSVRPLLRKDDEFQIKILTNGKVEINIEGQTFTSLSSFFSTANTWYQLAVTVDPVAGKIYLYRNGINFALNSNTLSAYNLTNSYNFYIGYGDTSGMALYKGLLSNFRIIVRALTSTEILSEYNSLITRDFLNIA